MIFGKINCFDIFASSFKRKIVAGLANRPRIWNTLHYLKLVEPSSQTIETELLALGRYAANADLAAEIGSYQGVSAVYIARAISPKGRLWSVDPWPDQQKRPNPCYSIFMRHVERSGVSGKISVVRKKSDEASDDLPETFDFAFIDGNHSWDGVDTDWKLMSPRMKQGGYICLHDSVVPSGETWRAVHDSVRYFEEVIRSDSRFEYCETVHSLVVLRRR